MHFVHGVQEIHKEDILMHEVIYLWGRRTDELEEVMIIELLSSALWKIGMLTRTRLTASSRVALFIVIVAEALRSNARWFDRLIS
jgi:hypothetical protein